MTVDELGLAGDGWLIVRFIEFTGIAMVNDNIMYNIIHFLSLTHGYGSIS
jgi:hypothetical protein